MMAEGRTAFLLATVALGLAGCHGADDARGLDRICDLQLRAGPACEVVGVGKVTSGVTGDAVGFALRDASLVVHLAAVPDLRSPGAFDVSLLAVAQTADANLDFAITWGSCAEGCPASVQAATTKAPREIAWATVASDVRGSEAGAKVPYDAVMTFTGVEVDILDLRIEATP